MLSHEALGLDSAMLDEARAYLRIDTEVEDASLSAILIAAINHAEQFTGQTLIRRNVTQRFSAGSGWQRLLATPVVRIVSVTGIAADGANFTMPESSYQTDIDLNDDAHIRIRRPGAAGRIEIVAEAGIANGWNDIPEALRLAILRLVGHLHANRDGAEDKGPPAAVAALLRPWRRMRLTSGAAR